MNLPRHTLTTDRPSALFSNASFNQPERDLFACATPTGWLVGRTNPLTILRRVDFSEEQGGLHLCVPLHRSNLLFLVGGGRVPRYAPNKVIIWDESLGAPSSPSAALGDEGALSDAAAEGEERERTPKKGKGKEVASLEFGETVRGLAVRRFPLPLPPPLPPSIPHGPDITAHRQASAVSGTGVDTTQSVSTAQRPRRTRTKRHPGNVLLAVATRSRVSVFEMVERLDEGATTSGSGGAPGAKGKGRGKRSTGRSARTGVRIEIVRRVVYETVDNDAGLVALSYTQHPQIALLALPGRQQGHVQLVRLPLSPPGSAQDDVASPSGLTPTMTLVLAHPVVSIIVAHSSPLSSITLNDAGTLLATASKKGTLLRVWATGVVIPPSPSSSKAASKPSHRSSYTISAPPAVLRKELRRGTDSASILSVSFCQDGERIAACSDKGTVHIWGLGGSAEGGNRGDTGSSTGKGEGKEKGGGRKEEDGRKGSSNLQSPLHRLTPYLPVPLPRYFHSEWSYAQFRLPLQVFPSSTRPSSASASPAAATLTSEGMGTGQGGEERQSSTDHTHRSRLSPAHFTSNFDFDFSKLGAVGGRVEELRRGMAPNAEVAKEEAAVIAWVAAGDGRKADEKGTVKWEEEGRGEEVEGRSEYRLVALTSSGGWYLISLDDDNKSAPLSPSRGMTEEKDEFGEKERTERDLKGKGRARDKDGNAPSSVRASKSAGATKDGDGRGGAGTGGERRETEGRGNGCRLLEHRTFGSIDGWS